MISKFISLNQRYMNLFPWQWATKKKDVVLSFKFESTFDADQLKSEFEACLEIVAPKTQFDVYHNGGWGGICLHALNGDPQNDRGGPGKYDYTPLISKAPYIKSILDAIPGAKERVRILTKKPGTNVYWHTDENETFDKGFIRLHVPIVTNSNYEFQLSHEDCSWNPGELWYGDFSFPHRLRNLDKSEINAHLVIDVRVSDQTLEYLGKDFCELQAKQSDSRNSARNICNKYYSYYNFFFDLKRYRIIAQNKLLKFVKFGEPAP